MRNLTTPQYLAIQARLTAYVAEQTAGKHWHDWPTVSALARRYRLNQATLLAMVEDSEQLDLIVGMRAGNAIGEFEHKGENRVEYIGPPLNPPAPVPDHTEYEDPHA